MRRAIDISDLPQSLIDALEAMIHAHREREAAAPSEKRAIGWARKELPELPPSFFDDLADSD